MEIGVLLFESGKVGGVAWQPSPSWMVGCNNDGSPRSNPSSKYNMSMVQQTVCATQRISLCHRCWNNRNNKEWRVNGAWWTPARERKELI